nr:reverse transcriptase domain-containing protein [Tanacetum cinerariifolium]
MLILNRQKSRHHESSSTCFKTSATLIPKDGYTRFQHQEQYEHVSPEVTRSQDDDKRLYLVDDLKEVQVHIQDQPFELMCDASDYAVGAVLGQRIKKHFRPIHYASKTMNQAKAKYTTTEKEMLAVVYAFKKFRSYLIMNKSIVYIDHSALKYLFAKKDAKARLLRWILLL